MRKLKIVQIECFYSGFLEALYSRHDWLAGQHSSLQTAFLLDSGFSGGHNVTPYLNPARWQSHYIVSNSAWTQSKWAEENGFRAGLPANEILALQLEKISPDVLYLSDIPGFDFSILSRLRNRPLIVGWHATVVDERIAWSEIDLLLSGIAPLREKAVALGAKSAECYMPGAPAYKIKPGSARRSGDLVFSGSFAGGIHNERIEQYRALSRSANGHILDIYTAARFTTEPDERIAFFPPVYGEGVLDLYSRYRVVLDSRGEFQLGDGGYLRETSNMRIFEATRAGALLMTEDSSNLKEYFSVGEEIETYASTDELIDKANFYCAAENDHLRRKIALAGHERVMREHLIEHRAIWFERIINSRLDLNRIAMAPAYGTHQAPEKTHLLCTSINVQSFIFGLDCISNLLKLYPRSAIWVHCDDGVSLSLLNTLGLEVHLISNEELIEPDAVDEVQHANIDWRAVQLIRFLRGMRPEANRISYIDSSINVLDQRILDLDAEDQAVYMLDYSFGANYGHAQEVLGTSSFALLSVGGKTAWHMLELASDEYSRVAADTGRVAWPDTVAKLAEGSGIEIRRITALAPWNFSKASASSCDGVYGQGVFLFFLVKLKSMTKWEFLSFVSEESWPQCYESIYVPYFLRIQTHINLHPAIASLGDQSSAMASSPLSVYMLRREFLIQAGYRLLSAEEFQGFCNTPLGWDSPAVASVQHTAFKFLIEEFKAGRGRQDLLALAGIMNRLARADMNVLEEGCGSGYNCEFIAHSVSERIRFTGIDLAPAMVALAKTTYPQATFEVMSSDNLKFHEDSFDVVLNGASLMHTVNYRQAISEARRVAKRFVVLHTVTIADMPSNVYFSKMAYGSEVVEVCFSSYELSSLLAENRLLPVLMKDSIDYNLESVVGVPTRSISLACCCLDDPVPDVKIAGSYNYYCTYFDSNYLVRGALMMRSLTRHDPRAFFFVLCLDELAKEAVSSMGPNILAIGAQELMDADPEFAQCRDNRSQIEWYFTATSSFVNYLFGKYGKLRRLTYLDADLYFYSSPEFLHFEAENASVQIIEHRFGEGLESLLKYGRFNVGWITFTSSTEEGRAVASDYRADCIEWCYDRVEGDRFGDQKYLDRWPERYPNCCISLIKGANVGPWNLSRWTVRNFGRDLFIDEDRLIFYHFQGIKRDESGQYATGQSRGDFGIYYDLLYAPYLKELGEMDRALASVIDKIQLKDIRYNSW